MKSLLFCFICVLCASACARADIAAVLSGGGGGTLDVIPLGDDRYQLDIDIAIPTATASVLTITATSGSSHIIEVCNIKAIGGIGSSVTLSFAGTSPGAIESVEEVNVLPPGTGQTAATVWVAIALHPTAGEGRVGIDPTLGTSKIEGHNFTTISCRELNADLGPPSGSSAGSIGTVSVAGDMTGDIEASSLTSLLVDDDIGSSGNPVTIDVDGNLTTLNARNVYASISVGGNLANMRVYGSSSKGATVATDAVFVGSLDCETMNLGAGLRI